MNGHNTLTGLRRWAMAAAVAGVAALVGPASAQVTGTAPSLTLGLGQTGSVNYNVTVADSLPIDGVNGEITFDSAQISAVTVGVGPDAPGYTAEGNLMAPGKFRFVLYKNPPGPAVSGNVLTFGFTAGAAVVGNVMTEASFTMGAAARIVGDEVVSLGVTGGHAINFAPISITINGIQPPVISSAPENQTVSVGRNVVFRAAATGQDVTLTWRKGVAVLATGPTLSLNNVTAADAGTYTVDATNVAGTVSADATLTVLDPAVANAAELVSHSIPTTVFPNAIHPFTVRMRNTSQVSWSADQLFAMIGVADTGTFLQNSTVLVSPDSQVVQPGEEHVFNLVLVAPAAPGSYQLSVSMTEGVTPFGPVVSGGYTVGQDMFVDLTDNPAGWLSAVLGFSNSGTSAEANSNGLCMTVPATGNNIVLWVSPERYVPLTDLTAYRMLVTPTTDQTANGAIPLWDIVYDNFNSTGFGNNYGGEQLFLDVSEGANGVGRYPAEVQFQAWAMPLAAQTPQWRGLLNTGAPGENDNSAFTPFADASNDMRIILRILDLDGAPLRSDLDFGTICVSSIHITGYALPTMGASLLWGPPINSATHLPQNSGQVAEGAGVAVIDDPNARALFQLTAAGAGARKTMFPFDSATFDPNNPGAFGPLYPVTWTSNVLYRGTIEAEATTNETDPVDTVFVNMDTATNELVNIHVTIVGSPPDNMYRASSPRLPATVGGQAQKYSSFYWGHKSTLIDLGLFPNADKFRVQADLYNVSDINPTVSGADQVAITKLYVEQITLP